MSSTTATIELEVKTEKLQALQKRMKELQTQMTGVADKSSREYKKLEAEFNRCASGANKLTREFERMKGSIDDSTKSMASWGDILQRSSGKRALVSNFADSFNDIVSNCRNASGAIRSIGAIGTEVSLQLGGIFGPVGLAIGGLTSLFVILNEQFDLMGTKAEESAKKASNALREARLQMASDIYSDPIKNANAMGGYLKANGVAAFNTKYGTLFNTEKEIDAYIQSVLMLTVQNNKLKIKQDDLIDLYSAMTTIGGIKNANTQGILENSYAQQMMYGYYGISNSGDLSEYSKKVNAIESQFINSLVGKRGTIVESWNKYNENSVNFMDAVAKRLEDYLTIVGEKTAKQDIDEGKIADIVIGYMVDEARNDWDQKRGNSVWNETSLSGNGKEFNQFNESIITEAAKLAAPFVIQRFKEEKAWNSLNNKITATSDEIARNDAEMFKYQRGVTEPIFGSNNWYERQIADLREKYNNASNAKVAKSYYDQMIAMEEKYRQWKLQTNEDFAYQEAKKVEEAKRKAADYMAQNKLYGTQYDKKYSQSEIAGKNASLKPVKLQNTFDADEYRNQTDIANFWETYNNGVNTYFNTLKDCNSVLGLMDRHYSKQLNQLAAKDELTTADKKKLDEITSKQNNLLKIQEAMTIAQQVGAMASAIGAAAKGANVWTIIPAVTATSAVVMSMMASAKKFANGGMVQSNKFNGDQLLFRANGGEVILQNQEFRQLVSAMAALRFGGNYGGGSLTTSVSGNDLNIVLERNKRLTSTF